MNGERRACIALLALQKSWSHQLHLVPHANALQKERVNATQSGQLLAAACTSGASRGRPRPRRRVPRKCRASLSLPGTPGKPDSGTLKRPDAPLSGRRYFVSASACSPPGLHLVLKESSCGHKERPPHDAESSQSTQANHPRRATSRTPPHAHECLSRTTFSSFAGRLVVKPLVQPAVL